MPGPLVALAPIVTAAGRFAVPYLAKELGKIGSNKFVQTYGNEAFTSLNETLTKNTTMVNPEAMPMVNPSFKAPGVIAPDAEEMEREAEKIREMTKPVGFPADPPIKPDIKTGGTTPPKIDTVEEFPKEEKLPDTLSTPIPDPEGPQIYYNRDAESKTTPKEYKGEITETTSLNENLKEAIAKYAGTPEDIAKSLKMPQSHKRKIYIQLEEYLNENYPSKLSEKEQEVESDALFYIANSVYDIYTFRGEGMPQDTLMVQDDIGFPLATAEIERYPKGKLNYYPRRKKGNKYVKTEPAVYIETIGSLNRDATSKILDQVEKIAEIEEVRYIVAEDLTSEAAAKALEKRGFVPAKKGFFEGDIINEADWRGGKKNVKQKNMVLDLGEKYRTTEEEIQKEFDKEQSDIDNQTKKLLKK